MISFCILFWFLFFVFSLLICTNLVYLGLGSNFLWVSKKNLELLIILLLPPMTGNIDHKIWFSAVLLANCIALNRVSKHSTKLNSQALEGEFKVSIISFMDIEFFWLSMWLFLFCFVCFSNLSLSKCPFLLSCQICKRRVVHHTIYLVNVWIPYYLVNVWGLWDKIVSFCPWY